MIGEASQSPDSDLHVPRVVLAKIGLDGHDRGVKVVARGLRDAGFHVIYAGLWQPIEAVVQTVLDEDADWLGISLLSGAHRTLLPAIVEELRQQGLSHVGVILGGIIPEKDVAELSAAGVRAVFGPGTPIAEIADFLRTKRPSRPNEDLLAEFHRQDRRALAHLLTLAAESRLTADLNLPAADSSARARAVAFTGSGGVGKSSLIGRVVELLRGRGESVAVLCCDPQSPLSGGALLGDRVRIAKPTSDPGVFIRSISTPSGQQAIAKNLDQMIALLKSFGFDRILVETVGAGQGDTAVRRDVDRLVVLLQPEAGDELQWEKAGLLEVADVVVIHKSDLPGAERVAAQVHEHVNLPGSRPVPVILASAAKGTGLAELWDAIDRTPPVSEVE